MNEQTALMPIDQGTDSLSVTTYEGMWKLGTLFAKSKMFGDATDAAQAFVKILAGQELGIPPFVAMTGIYVIKGRVSLGADVLAKKVKGSGKYDYRVKQHTEKICEIEFFENGKSLGVSTFTIEDARRAGTQNLEKFARNMLFARAISNGVRWFCPDVVTMPVYVEGEIFDQAEEPAAAQSERVIDGQSELPREVELVTENKSEVIEALKKVAKACGLDSTGKLRAELRNVGVELSQAGLQVALEALTAAQRVTALEHLQSLAIEKQRKSLLAPNESSVLSGEYLSSVEESETI